MEYSLQGVYKIRYTEEYIIAGWAFHIYIVEMWCMVYAVGWEFSEKIDKKPIEFCRSVSHVRIRNQVIRFAYFSLFSFFAVSAAETWT